MALLAGCSYTDVGPAPATVAVASSAPATVTVVVPSPPTAAIATAPAVPAPPRSCTSNADCATEPTGGICMPKATTKPLADAEDFLGRAMSLDDLVLRLGDTSPASPLKAMRQRVRDDVVKYGWLKSGRSADGKQELQLTNEQMQDAAWFQSGATQAEWSVQAFSRALSSPPLTTDAQKVHVDIVGDAAGMHLDALVGDVETLLQDVDAASAPVDKLITLREADGSPLTPKSGAGALLVYTGPTMKELGDSEARVLAHLDPSAASRLKIDLARLSRLHDLLGKDGSAGECLSP